VRVFGRFDQRHDIRLATHIDAPARTTDLARHRGCSLLVAVCDHHMPRALLMETLRHGTANAICAPRHHDELACDFHVGFPAINNA
jgi:hypothetical protein